MFSTLALNISSTCGNGDTLRAFSFRFLPGYCFITFFALIGLVANNLFKSTAAATGPISIDKHGNVLIKVLAKPGAKHNNVTGNVNNLLLSRPCNFRREFPKVNSTISWKSFTQNPLTLLRSSIRNHLETYSTLPKYKLSKKSYILLELSDPICTTKG